MHLTVNERLRQQVQFLALQVEQLRMTMGVLVHRLGDYAAVEPMDLAAMKRDGLLLATTVKQVPVGLDDGQVMEQVVFEILTAEQVRARQAEAPRIVAPTLTAVP